MQCVHPRKIWNPKSSEYFYVPCGKCVPCNVSKSREWAMRVIHELPYWEDSVFLTLTYDKDSINENFSLDKKELQNYFKRLRKNLNNRKIKYYACGEYGDTFGRPHYHAIVFGVSISEHKMLQKRIISGPLHDSWGHGYTYAGTATYQSARYISKYLNKEIVKGLDENYYKSANKEPPFRVNSNGLGLRYAQQNSNQLNENLYYTFHGIKQGLPLYYKRKLSIDSDRLRLFSAQKFCETAWKYLKNVTNIRQGVIDQQNIQARKKAKRFSKQLKWLAARQIRKN